MKKSYTILSFILACLLLLSPVQAQESGMQQTGCKLVNPTAMGVADNPENGQYEGPMDFMSEVTFSDADLKMSPEITQYYEGPTNNVTENVTLRWYEKAVTSVEGWNVSEGEALVVEVLEPYIDGQEITDKSLIQDRKNDFSANHAQGLVVPTKYFEGVEPHVNQDRRFPVNIDYRFGGIEGYEHRYLELDQKGQYIYKTYDVTPGAELGLFWSQIGTNYRDDIAAGYDQYHGSEEWKMTVFEGENPSGTEIVSNIMSTGLAEWGRRTMRFRVPEGVEYITVKFEAYDPGTATASPDSPHWLLANVDLHLLGTVETGVVVDKFGKDSLYEAGEAFTATINVKNSGITAVEDVSTVVTFTDDLIYVPAEGDNVTVDGNTLTIPFGALNSGDTDSKVLNFKFKSYADLAEEGKTNLDAQPDTVSAQSNWKISDYEGPTGRVYRGSVVTSRTDAYWQLMGQEVTGVNTNLSAANGEAGIIYGCPRGNDPLYYDARTAADRTTPEGISQDVVVGTTLTKEHAKKGIKDSSNTTLYPDGTTFAWVKENTPDTSSPAMNVAGKVKITYSDNTFDIVDVTVNVIEEPSATPIVTRNPDDSLVIQHKDGEYPENTVVYQKNDDGSVTEVGTIDGNGDFVPKGPETLTPGEKVVVKEPGKGESSEGAVPPLNPTEKKIVTATPNSQRVPEGSPITKVVITPEDPAGVITVDKSKLPDGVSVSEDGKTVTGTPKVTDWTTGESARKFTIPVTVKNSDGSTSTTEFTIIVIRKSEDPTPVTPKPVDPIPVTPKPVEPTPVDPKPVDPKPVDPDKPKPVDPKPVDPLPEIPKEDYGVTITNATQKVTEGNPIETITITPDDPKASVTIPTSKLPDGVTYDPKTMTITGTPSVTDWKTGESERVFTVDVTVTNSDGSVVLKTIEITVVRMTSTGGSEYQANRSPKTGDVGMLPSLAMIGVSVLGLVFTSKKKKDRR